jgi:glucosylceramidase
MHKRFVGLIYSIFLAASFGSAGPAHADELFWLAAKHSGKCISVHEGLFQNGVQIEQWDCINQTNVKVRKVPMENGTFQLQFEHDNKCAQVNGASHADNAPVTQFDCVKQANVLWKEGPAADGFLFITNVESGKCLQQQGGTQGNGDIISQWECDVNKPNTQWKWSLAPTP